METNDTLNKQSSLAKSSDMRRTTRPQQTATIESEDASSERISSHVIEETELETISLHVTEETELETTSSLTRPVSTRSANTSAKRSHRSNDKRRVVPLVEELPCTPPEHEETQSGLETEEAEARAASEPPDHAVGAHKVRGRNYVSMSSTEEIHTSTSSIRDVSRASSANEIVVPSAHVVEEDDVITAYVVEPPSIFNGDASGKPLMDEEAACCSCVCPCVSCKVQNAEQSRKRRTYLFCIAGALAALFISLAATGWFRSDPTPPLDQEQLRSLIANASPDGGASLNDTESYQYASFSWLEEDPRLSGFSDSQVLERYSLACLYHSLKGAEWKEKDGWMAHGRSVCDWYNVTCAAWPNITSVRLIRNNLSGKIFAPEIIMMKSLHVLELEGNFISSTIPEEIGTMSSLEHLLLRNNSLLGTVPSELAKLSSLQYLKLHRNDFTGTIPTGLSSMDSMVYLTLGDNALNSTIPSQLSQMKNLKVLKLYQNELTSSIPSELGLISSLDTLDLDRNRLVSTIPTELGNLMYLDRLRLHGNKLVGSFPASICNLTNNIIVDCAINCTCCRKCKRRF